MKCVIYSGVCYLSLFLCNISHSRAVSNTIIFKILIFSFKLMNMFGDRCEQSHRLETPLCAEIYKKVEQLVEGSHSLQVGLFDGHNYKVLDETTTLSACA